jgi:hypothetical protein
MGAADCLDDDWVASYFATIAVPALTFSRSFEFHKSKLETGRRSVAPAKEIEVVEPAFYSDKDVARRLSMSPSWVRQQRFKKSRGLANDFDLEPCRIGGGVRYVVAEVEAYVAAIVHGQP